MAKFYATINADLSRTLATKRGSKYIKTSTQSYNGSIITTMYYNEQNKLMIEIETTKTSNSCYGENRYRGTFAQLEELLVYAQKVGVEKAITMLKEEDLKEMRR